MAVDCAALTRWFEAFADLVDDNAAHLTELDRQIGDADHGSNMQRGLRAVHELDTSDLTQAGPLLKKVGLTLVSTVGGASGPLFGTFFLRFASAATAPTMNTQQVAAGLRAGLEGIMARGKGVEGDKTLVDALAPAVRAFGEAQQQGATMLEAWQRALAAGIEGRDATADMVARKGRASYLGDRSRGTVDPGAASMVLLLESAADTLGR